jgi:hypothetical protein
MHALALALAAAALAAAPPALAGPSITLNGVSIDGVTGQRFENATVVIDAAGNVHIEAKGYAVKGSAADPTAAAPAAPPVAAPLASRPVASASGLPGRLARRYFLATEQSQPDGTQFDVEVFINASWIRVLRSADPQAVLEITRYLRPGTNKVTLACTKKLQGAERRYYTPDVTLKVVVGEGNVGGDHVMIDEPLVLMTRTAAEVDDKVEEYVFEAR